MVVAYHLLRRSDTFAYRPARVACVEVGDEHLEVFPWRGCQGEFEAAVYVVAELP